MNIDKYITNLNGIKNGDATSIAIISLLSGNALSSGEDSMVYISPEKGIRKIKIIKTNNNIFDNLFLSSNKCGTNELLL